MRKLPPLNAVRTFEAAARHVSFTNAAAELFVTHGAVSRQVALLEDWFGIKLFRRSPSQISLTEAGQLYYREITAILDRLALASMDMKERAAPSVLRINAPPTFTMRWLIRRLNAFQRKRPDVELRMTTLLGPINANDISVDVAILAGQGDIPGWKSIHFMTEFIAPVCHADLIKRGELRTMTDLVKHTLITYQTEPYGWDQWATAAGGELSGGQDKLRFEQMFFALQAALDGLGIGLFPLFLIIDELVDKKLVVPFGSLGVSRRNYNLWYREDAEGHAVIKEFCSWISDAGRLTEQTTLAWVNSMGWEF